MGAGYPYYRCIPCPAGTYSDGGLVTSCTTCPVGTYTSYSGQGVCTPCAECPAGQAYTQCTSTTSDNSQCTPCSSGAYSAGGYATTCISCPSGTYIDANLGKCNSCVGCRQGQAYTQCSINSLLDNHICTDCNPGTYSIGGYIATCSSCPNGQYSGNAYSACLLCSAGTYSDPSTKPYCNNCPSGKYSLAGASLCISCPSGFYSSINAASQCSACPSGQYSAIGASQCSTCPFGTYSGIGAGQCTTCLSGTYSLVGSGKCSTCLAGTYSVIGASQCILCGAGQYSATGSAQCNQCGSGQYSLTGSSQCIICSSGKYSLAGASQCSICPAGTYSAAGVSQCSMCPAGTWGESVGQTGQSTGCANNCPAGTYGSVAGAMTRAAACPYSCPAGTWGASVGQTSRYTACTQVCASGTWGNVTGSGSVATGCPYSCPAGTYGTAVGATAFSDACPGVCPAGTWGSVSGGLSVGIACPYLCPYGRYGTVTGASSMLAACPGQCPPGTYYTGTGMTSASAACSTCAVCMPYMVQDVQCFNTSQSVCGHYSGSLFYYSDNSGMGGTMMLYNPTTGPSLVGYRPYQYLLPYVSTYTKYMYPSNQEQGPGSTPLPYGYIPTVFTVNFMIACQPLPVGRVFKPWMPAVTSISCTKTNNPDDCFGALTSCNIPDVSQCTGFVAATNAGYYQPANSLTCVPCTSSAPQPTCGWGKYGNISACSPTSNTTCAPCYGSKPANAVWVGPVSPYYFASSPQCTWACGVGYYPDSNGGCAQCTLPPNALGFKPGDILGNNPVYLYPGGPRQLFGGSMNAGCKVLCPVGTYFYFGYSSDGTLDPSSVQCLTCPAPPICPLGQTLTQDPNGCQTCHLCAAVGNAFFTTAGSCAFQCLAGYFLLGGSCQPCTSLSSVATSCLSVPGFYVQACTPFIDTTCTPCSAACTPATYTQSACNATSDLVCATCPRITLANGVIAPECVPTCNTGYAYSANQSACLPCATSPSNCPADKQFVQCDNVYYGCQPCPPVLYTVPWCWTGQPPGSCMTNTIAKANNGALCQIIPIQFRSTNAVSSSQYATTSASNSKTVATTAITSTAAALTTLGFSSAATASFIANTSMPVSSSYVFSSSAFQSSPFFTTKATTTPSTPAPKINRTFNFISTSSAWISWSNFSVNTNNVSSNDTAQYTTTTTLSDIPDNTTSTAETTTTTSVVVASVATVATVGVVAGVVAWNLGLIPALALL